MRIISGKYKGFRFPSHSLHHTRPTTDRAKESLFNILQLQYDFEEISVLDLYSGTGNIAFEFISRGVQNLTSIELSYQSIQYIKKVASLLKADIHLVKGKVLKELGRLNQSYDVIFADPPYQSPDYAFIVDAVLGSGILKAGGVFILEHPGSMKFNDTRLREQRSYGQSTFSFFTFESNG